MPYFYLHCLSIHLPTIKIKQIIRILLRNIRVLLRNIRDLLRNIRDLLRNTKASLSIFFHKIKCRETIFCFESSFT